MEKTSCPYQAAVKKSRQAQHHRAAGSAARLIFRLAATNIRNESYGSTRIDEVLPGSKNYVLARHKLFYTDAISPTFPGMAS